MALGSRSKSVADVLEHIAELRFSDSSAALRLAREHRARLEANAEVSEVEVLDLIAAEASCHIGLGEYEEAIRVASIVLGRGADEREHPYTAACITTGTALVGLGKFAEAEGYLQRALELIHAGVDDVRLQAGVHFVLGNLFLSSDRLDEAKSSLTEAQSLAPPSSPVAGYAASVLGGALIEAGDVEGGIAALWRSLQQHRHNNHRRGIAWTLHNLGNALAYVRRNDEARNANDECLRILDGSDGGAPEDDDRLAAFAWLLRGRIQLAFNQPQDAVTSLVRGIDIARRLKNPHLEGLGRARLSLAHLQVGDAETAMTLAQEAQGMRPDCPDVLIVVARAHSHLDEHEEACEALDRALSLVTINKNAFSTIETHSAAVRILARAGRPECALEHQRILHELEIRAIRKAAESQVEHMQLELDLERSRYREALLEESRAELERQVQHRTEELRETQRQVVAQERLRALGEMATGVAHDLNNTLVPILSYSDLLLSASGLPAELRPRVESIAIAAQDAADVVRRLQRHFSLAPHKRERCNVQALVSEAIELARPKWSDEALSDGRVIEIEQTIEPIELVCNPVEIRAVLVNLLRNSVDAIEESGRIKIGAVRRRGVVVIEVSDTGIGMSGNVLAQCFDPFFTTKGDRGTGLGLSTCRAVIQEHGGSLDVETAPWRGATFRIYLPTDAAELPEEASADDQELERWRVLFVDDDARVRLVIGELLDKLDQQVTVVDSGAAALAEIDKRDFDVLLTDQGMPGMDGSELAAKIRERGLRIPIAIISGWSSLRIHAACDAFLLKPVTLADLRGLLARLQTRT